MSVYYDVNEHLVIGDVEKHYDVASYAASQLSMLGAWMLMGQASFGKLTVIADGVEYRFSGNIVTEAYHNLVAALRKARRLEIISSYGYSWRVGCADPGPFPLVEYLREIANEDSAALSGMFYSMYNNADCGSSAGGIVAFGEKNGHMYTGEVAFKEVDSIPDGDWYTPLTAVVFESDETQGMDIPAIMDVCRQLSEFSSMDDLYCTEDGEITFCLNNLRIQTDAQLKRVLALYAQLVDLTNGECSLIGELADISGPDIRMLQFDVNAEGAYLLNMAAVAE